jgi:TolB protein
MVGFDALGQDSGNAEIPPCASPEKLATLFSGTIVYEGDPIDGEDPNRSFDIWVIGAPDWTPKLVAGDFGFDGHPVWSPDGQRIVYSAHGDKNPDLYLIDPDGRNRTRLTTAEGRDDYPKWLPEGIVYKNGSKRLLMDPVSGEIATFEAIASGVEGYTFSSDRKRIIFTRRIPSSIETYRLFLAESDGTVIRQCPSEHPRAIMPHWSPVDNRIVYSGGDGQRDGKWEVYSLDLDTGTTTQLTDNPGADWAQGWSPDGKWVLIASEYGGNWDIYAIRPDGSDRIRITCHAGNARGPSWTRAEPLAKTRSRQGEK